MTPLVRRIWFLVLIATLALTPVLMLLGKL